jgi:DNA (cytosine-5)-methyltransferase 1
MDTSKATTHLGLCAGYGGIELGLQRAIPDLRTVALCEIEAFAIANLVSKMEAGLMDPAPIWPNLKTFPWGAFRDRVDILTGGYPCQPFSAAGQRKGKQDPRHLWPWIADGIRLLRPRCCFFENVEGHISLGLSDVIEDLAGMGYRTTWGIFSASECGAPHQRKRVFILAYRAELRGKIGYLAGQKSTRETDHVVPRSQIVADDISAGLEGLTGHDNASGESRRITEGQDRPVGESSLCYWPSRPGEQQYGWEPPRVVGNTESRQDNGREPGDMGEEASQGGCGDDAADGAGEDMADSHRVDRSAQAEGREHDRQAGSAGESDDDRKVERTVGLHTDECSSVLGETLTFNPNGDNVAWHEKPTKKTRAREVLFEVWIVASTEGLQWETGRLQYLLAEKILQSGVQLDGFTQRICFFVWCIQTGHQTQGWGLHGMQVYESSRGSSQGQEPIEQLKRELGYAMCQLSYEIALEGRQEAVEREGILQGVRKSSERAWSLSKALPEMEEVWRSTLDQKVWENGCFVEATSAGNRTDELRLLGNGVVPATAERAFRTLIRELL